MKGASSASHGAEPPRFLSLGLVVLDELHFTDRESLYDVSGGSGAYATLGARMFAGAARSKSVACIILAGVDFPIDIFENFKDWNLLLVVQSVPNAASTRGRLEYLDANFGDKQFRYLTPPLHPKVEHLEASFLLRSAAFHMLAQPEVLELQVEDLLSRRSQHGITPSPIIIWEPAPPHCTPLNHDAHVRASKHVDVFSPNHIELASLFEEYDTTSKSLDRANIEEYARRFQEANSVDSTNETKIVVRAGEHGCLVMSKAEGAFWLPPFYDSASPKVLDPTGAGNTFLGAFTIALQHTGSLKESSIYGSVAASFALEQIGMPTLASSSGTEEWNGAEFLARLGEYRRRL